MRERDLVALDTSRPTAFATISLKKPCRPLGAPESENGMAGGILLVLAFGFANRPEGAGRVP